MPDGALAEPHPLEFLDELGGRQQLAGGHEPSQFSRCHSASIYLDREVDPGIEEATRDPSWFHGEALPRCMAS